jgi:hypothetical protein
MKAGWPEATVQEWVKKADEGACASYQSALEKPLVIDALDRTGEYESTSVGSNSFRVGKT